MRALTTRILVTGVLALPAAFACAQGVADPHFEIKDFRIEGGTLLSPAEGAAVVAPYTGPERSFTDIQKAREALQRAYADRGYGAVQIVLPEQEVTRGEVVLRIVETRVGAIAIEGNKFFDEPNIRASLPALVAGEPLNTHRLAKNLTIANENPAKQTTVTLKGGAAEGDVDATVRVTDQKPYKFLVSLDNTGTRQTGEWRTGVGFQHANLWNRDHVLNLQYITSPSHEDAPNKIGLPPNNNVKIFGGSYHIPLPQWGDSIDLLAGYANVNSGVVQNVFNISGAGRVYAARYNLGLRTWREIEHKIAFGVDVRYYGNNVVPVGGVGSLVASYVIHPISATYIAVRRSATAETSGYFGVVHNISGGANGDDAQFALVRPGAKPDYNLQRAGFNHLQSLPADVQLRLNLTAQFTRDKLVPGEQFGIGGFDSVRGFLEREIVNDKGYRGTVEVYSPDFGGRTLVQGLRARLLAFYDWGMVRRNDPEPGAVASTGIGSVGIGLRLSYNNNLSVRADLARVVDGGGARNEGVSRGHLSVIYAF